MVRCMFESYEGRDLGTPDKIVGVNLTTTPQGTSLDQVLYAEGSVIKDMGSTDVRKVNTPLDPGMDLSARRDGEEELDVSRFPYARIWESSCS